MPVCRLSALAVAAALFVAAAAEARAACPRRPVTVVVPYGAGGSTDALARPLASQLARAWGVPVVVENRTGANGIVATASVARAPGDGRTILLHLTALVQNASLHRKLPFDPFTDLAPVLRIGVQPMALAVGRDSPHADLRTLLQALAAHPQQGSYGSFGTGSTGHIYGELLRKATGSSMAHVPHRGEAQLLPELVSGRVDVGFVSAAAAIDGQRAGTLRVLALTGTHRLAALPHVPTLSESGLGGFELVGWYGLFVPATTPPGVTQCIATSSQWALAEPQVAQRLRDLAIEAQVAGPDPFAVALREDFRRWDGLIKGFGIALDHAP